MSLADRLRAALEAPHAEAPILLPSDDYLIDPQVAGREAAVLVAITDRAEPGIILTTRTETLRSHAGQVAFPGGRIDPDDDGPVGAALREAEEEIALSAGKVWVIGVADRYRTVTGFDVTPVVGVVPPDLPLVPAEAEVADVFEVPLSFLFDPANHVQRVAEHLGRERRYYEILWRERRIWGATAAMLINLSRRMRWEI
ncbi:CoA pyrophosphatase [Sphingomonas sp. M1-B02]|uniref:CoA pyrophosphatase n=1 Tax=Sphingomonas sp. M1-B02 TaxID=3114300 RepID=UPI00223F86ED|nr:CoA pyrophosphatase [Sphingomonas sp. S6-11]UZK66723.1 CoA pyrophosphatase [Sphingomonas sp. S6-11]